jgi:hypothetical protein
MIILVIIGTNENRDPGYFCSLVNEIRSLIGLMGITPQGMSPTRNPINHLLVWKIPGSSGWSRNWVIRLFNGPGLLVLVNLIIPRIEFEVDFLRVKLDP